MGKNKSLFFYNSIIKKIEPLNYYTRRKKGRFYLLTGATKEGRK